MKTELLAVQQRGVALDYARLLHVLDAPSAQLTGQADLVRNFLNGAAGVQLQKTQDFL